jgi:hypothetical protein
LEWLPKRDELRLGAQYRLQVGLQVCGRSRLHSTPTRDFKGNPDWFILLKAGLQTPLGKIFRTHTLSRRIPLQE